MVRLLIDGKIYPKRFPSADSARIWFSKAKRIGSFKDKVAALVNESNVKYHKKW